MKGEVLTLQERKEIEAGISKGMSLRQVAVNIGRSNNGVIREVNINGGRESYNAYKAHSEALERNRRRKEKLSQRNRVNSPSVSYAFRIQNLEDQMQILAETIKGLINAKDN